MNGRTIVALAAVSTVIIVAVLLISPRFALDEPSLVDDWAAIELTSSGLAQVSPLASHDDIRFRPTWTAFSYAQWHTLDAPGPVGPNVWNLLRLALLVIGLWGLTFFVLPSRPKHQGVDYLRPLLAAVPPLIVVTTPGLAVDLARFGPQEPALVGAMALGAVLIVIAAREIISRSSRDAFRVGGFAVAGVLCWAYGVYHKETSISVLALFPLLVGAGWVRRRHFMELPRWRKVGLLGLGIATAFPVVHTTFEVARLSRHGDLIYGAEIDIGTGAFRKFGSLILPANGTLGTPLALVLIIGVVAAVAAGLLRGRSDATDVGLALVLVGTIFFEAQLGEVVSRYYLPALALASVILVRWLARLTPRVRTLTLATVGVVLLMSCSVAYSWVGRWAEREEAGELLVDSVAAFAASGCRVAVTGLEEEHAVALPVLVSLKVTKRGHCDSTDLLLVQGREAGDPELLRSCKPHSLRRIASTLLAEVFRCEQLVSSPFAGDDGTLHSADTVIRAHELVITAGATATPAEA